MERIRLLLVDDHVLFRESLARLLASEADFEVSGQCSEAQEALDTLKRAPVDVVLLDFDLRGLSGAEVAAAARDAGYVGKILMVTADMDAASSLGALRLGVAGIFLKHNPADALLRAIRVVAAGDVWLDRKIVQLLAGSALAPGARSFQDSLTERERQVLSGLLEGFTNRMIAERLNTNESVVKSAFQQLFQKAGVRTRAQLVRLAIEGTAAKPEP